MASANSPTSGNSPTQQQPPSRNSPTQQYQNRTNEINSLLLQSRPQMIDEGENPMANVLDDASDRTGQLAPRNMSAWIARACESILGKRYVTQDSTAASKELASAMMRNAYIQTEPPAMKDASAMIIDGNMESERLNNLDIGIPGPADLPVLTTSQLLELERRLGDLMGRLEEEVRNAEGEIKRAKEQAAELEKRESVMHSNRFGKWQTNEEWVLRMRNKIEGRLHKRHGYADVPSLPTQKLNLDSTLNSPLQTKNTRARRPDLMAASLGVDSMSGNPPHMGSVSRGSSDLFEHSGTTPMSITPARSVTPTSQTLNADGQPQRLQKKGSFVAFQDPVEMS